MIKIQENLYLIDTKILQFDLLEAEIIRSKVNNPFKNILEKMWEIFTDLLLIGQIAKFLCLSDIRFPEFPPYFCS